MASASGPEPERAPLLPPGVSQASSYHTTARAGAEGEGHLMVLNFPQC